MREIAFDDELAALLATFVSIGGVLDFVLLEPTETCKPEELHRSAALEGMAAIDRRYERYSLERHSKEYPIEMFLRLKWDQSKASGDRIRFAEFWGTDEVEPKQVGSNAWSIPNIDGFKPAFFHPPYGLRGPYQSQAALFDKIVTGLFGNEPNGAEIFSWSTDWSNYFDAGHEWWGAFYWTIRPEGANRCIVVAASTTD